MSELGNKIRLVRGELSQIEFADKTGVSLRTICKIEAGETVRLQTVRKIAESLEITERERLEWMVHWIRLEVGEDFHKLHIEIQGAPRAMSDSDHLLGKIQVLLSDLPRKFQEQIYLSLQRPELLRCLQHLNELYDSMKRERK
jgi:transcriptional regulator with XRE-family HTH domain